MAFIYPGDEVIVFEPFFDAYDTQIAFAGGKMVSVAICKPNGWRSSAGWTFDMAELEKAVTPRTKMMVSIVSISFCGELGLTVADCQLTVTRP